MTLKSLLASAAVALTATAAATTADALDRWVVIGNTSNVTLTEVYITHVDDSYWGRDLLGWDVLPGGWEADFHPDYTQGYCLFDIQVAFADGNVWDLYDVNLCEVDVIDIDNWGYYDVYY